LRQVALRSRIASLADAMTRRWNMCFRSILFVWLVNR
jgi:hypothetical protein